MNVQAIDRLRARLAQGEPVYGMWVTLEAPSITEAGVALGLDWIVIDAEHGHLDWKEIVEHLRAAVRSETTMLVRIAEDNPGLVKRALDSGADGIVVPLVQSAAQLRRIVEMARYPIAGIRGIGAERATCWGQCMPQHVREAATHTLVVPIIETVQGIANLREMLEVEGVEIFWFGPADHSASAGYPGQWEGPGVAGQIMESVRGVRAAGKHAGVVARNEDDAISRQAQGFRLLGLGADMGFILNSLRRMLGVLARTPHLQTSLQPMDTHRLVEQSKQTPLDHPPDAFRPDRSEVLNRPGQGPQIEIEPGVRLDCLVGAHNQARKLTTGIVSIDPGAALSCHRHSCGESVTLLEGELLIEVEGRSYRLESMDNITIPAGLAHKAVNPSAGVVRAHVALASSAPDRQDVAEKFAVKETTADALGSPGKEHVVRFKLARRYAAGPNTEFIDHLNSDLIPGIEMSGGYGLFHQGGRLPAHIHDFDESICIIRGGAVCNVEGRRHQMSGCETALVPRGRIHYFIDEAPEPMAMLWVYAGPLPERILIDEACTTPAADPWMESPRNA